jgi:hypothetical protein
MMSKKPTPRQRKLKIIHRLIEVPKKDKKFFWAKEMKILNDLEDRYSLDFLEVVSFRQKYDSLAYIASEPLKKTMDRKWSNFNFKVDSSKYESFDLSEKCGEDHKPSYHKPKNARELFNE